MEHFLATGNLISRTNLDLQQTAGFTIVADKLNNTAISRISGPFIGGSTSLR
jgi:hypothetical protein